jgi:hypothetical protein
LKPKDNQSTILLEKNGCGSGSKRTCHINICYFFVTDRIQSKEVSVEYCPTSEMIADFFTKPLQGMLFCKFCAFIMNLDPGTDSLQDKRSVLSKAKTAKKVKVETAKMVKVETDRRPQVTWSEVVKRGRDEMTQSAK